VTLSVYLTLGFASAILAGAFFLTLLYRGWTVLKKQGVPVSPELMVWLLLIPIFNWYWSFISVRRLFIQANKTYIALAPGQGKKLGGQFLSTAFCILNIILGFWTLLFIIDYQAGYSTKVPLWAIFFSLLLLLLFTFFTGFRIKKIIQMITTFDVQTKGSI
jgi:hypothetical protein